MIEDKKEITSLHQSLIYYESGLDFGFWILNQQRGRRTNFAVMDFCLIQSLDLTFDCLLHVA